MLVAQLSPMFTRRESSESASSKKSTALSAVESKCTTLGRIKVHQSREGWFLQRLSQCGNVVDGFSATIALKAG
jgi:hypothetical protein